MAFDLEWLKSLCGERWNLAAPGTATIDGQPWLAVSDGHALLIEADLPAGSWDKHPASVAELVADALKKVAARPAPSEPDLTFPISALRAFCAEDLPGPTKCESCTRGFSRCHCTAYNSGGEHGQHFNECKGCNGTGEIQPERSLAVVCGLQIDKRLLGRFIAGIPDESASAWRVNSSQLLVRGTGWMVVVMAMGPGDFEPFPCGQCKHEHRGSALGGICIGCPCAVDQPDRDDTGLPVFYISSGDPPYWMHGEGTDDSPASDSPAALGAA